MQNLDFSSWQSHLATLFGLALVTLLGVGIRLLTQMAFQQRRERMNRQINERLRTLIAAYKVLGGSFTGDLTVDPTHKRDLRSFDPPAPAEPMAQLDLSAETASNRTARGEYATRSKPHFPTSFFWVRKSMSGLPTKPFENW
ncbi:hypothetical protein U1737_07345 [Sphingomonas sp. LB3N6]|uniref:hypothetical protein n=1 Tax=Sphingomonas fucosidasi TaxID=3096164 RepID=UPI002FCA9005